MSPQSLLALAVLALTRDVSAAQRVPADHDIPTRFLERTLAAYEALDTGELERARELFTANLARFPEHANSAYALACIAAREGQADAALDELARAVELGFADALFAGQDDDLASLAGEQRFAELLSLMARRPAAQPSQRRLVWTESTEFPWYSSDGSRVDGTRGSAGSSLDARSGREFRLRRAPSLDIRAFALHPDGTRAVFACADGSLRTLELATGRTLLRTRPRAGRIDSCEWSSDGARLLVAWSDGTFGWFDGATGDALGLHERALAARWVQAFASADGRRVIVRVAEGCATLHDGETGAPLAELGPAGRSGMQVIHSTTNRVAAAQADGRIALFDLDTGAREPQDFLAADQVCSVAFSSDGTLLAAGTLDRGVCIWRIADGELLRRHMVPDEFDPSLDVRAIEFDADGTSLVYTTGGYGTVRRLEIASGADRMLLDTRGGNGGTIALHSSASTKRLYVHGMVGRSTPVLDAATGSPLMDLGEESVELVDGTRDDRWVVAAVEHAARVFGERLDARYTYVPFEKDGWIAKADSLHCAGTAEALRWSVVVRGVESYPFVSCASELLDPKRVRAAALGVAARPAELGVAPAASVVGSAIREIAASANTVELELELVAPRGIAACEAELDGVRLDEPATTALVRGPSAGTTRATLRLPRKPGVEPNELCLILFDRSGLGSRVVRARFVAQ
ncbi:MAG: hypothetical protein HZA52_03035 [Planctomycetes bacterium]|nr:hypothetical protein [Planctomycetota bacterium]